MDNYISAVENPLIAGSKLHLTKYINNCDHAYYNNDYDERRQTKTQCRPTRFRFLRMPDEAVVPTNRQCQVNQNNKRDLVFDSARHDSIGVIGGGGPCNATAECANNTTVCEHDFCHI
ncbi:hypothetical protein DPMN_176670, partial [Dreissena polymorpha]